MTLFEQSTQRLEERLVGAKERQDALMNELRADQSKLQEEVRSTIMSLKLGEYGIGDSSKVQLGHRAGKSTVGLEDGAESGRPSGIGFGSGPKGGVGPGRVGAPK